jgi:hypothetical protein
VEGWACTAWRDKCCSSCSLAPKHAAVHLLQCGPGLGTWSRLLPDICFVVTVGVHADKKDPFPEGYCGHVQQELDQLRARFDWQVC